MKTVQEIIQNDILNDLNIDVGSNFNVGSIGHNGQSKFLDIGPFGPFPISTSLLGPARYIFERLVVSISVNVYTIESKYYLHYEYDYRYDHQNFIGSNGFKAYKKREINASFEAWYHLTKLCCPGATCG